MRLHKPVGDLGAAAFIMMHKFKVVGKKEKSIYFEVDENEEGEIDRLYRDYLSSEFHRFDSCIMSLKKLGEYNFDSKNKRFVTDLGAGAYLLMQKYNIIGRKGKALYFDDDEESKFDETTMEYMSSDFHRFDSCLMSLKKMNDSFIAP